MDFALFSSYVTDGVYTGFGCRVKVDVAQGWVSGSNSIILEFQMIDNSKKFVQIRVDDYWTHTTHDVNLVRNNYSRSCFDVILDFAIFRR